MSNEAGGRSGSPESYVHGIVGHCIKSPARALRKLSTNFSLDTWPSLVFLATWERRMPHLSCHLKPVLDNRLALVNLYPVWVAVEEGVIDKLLDVVTTCSLQRHSWILRRQASGTFHPFCGLI